jgi:gephyrin
MGILATIGVTEVSVFKVPQIGVLSTGDELNEPNEELSPGHIRDSNRSMLLSAIEDADPAFKGGCTDLGIARDNEKDLMTKVMEGLQKSDIVITTGGVSMGELDLIQPILQKLGKNCGKS